jgi:chromosome segregation ATPase
VSHKVSEFARHRDDWKKRAIKLARRERALERHTRDLERQLKKQLRRQRSTPTVAHAPTVNYENDLVAMQSRLAETERALTLAREHLSAIEVKLEILEGAANVLDARTRTQVIGSTAG